MFQMIAPISAAKITCGETIAGIDDAGAERFGHMQAEEQKGDEIEEGRPGDGILRPQHPGRDDRGDRVGRIMQAVEKIEEQRDTDQADQQRKGERGFHQTFSMTMPLISLATSSKRSTTFSSSP